MSVNEFTESSESVFQTHESVHEELKPCREETADNDVGVSPELVGPVTRSGKKRRHPAPVKSAGKKKKKTMTTRSPPVQGKELPQDKTIQPTCQPRSTPIVPGPSHRPLGVAPSLETLAAGDFAAIFANGLNNIQQSMGAMEARLSGKIDGLESWVSKNKESIVVLTNTVNKNTIDLARLESQM